MSVVSPTRCLRPLNPLRFQGMLDFVFNTKKQWMGEGKGRFFPYAIFSIGHFLLRPFFSIGHFFWFFFRPLFLRLFLADTIIYLYSHMVLYATVLIYFYRQVCLLCIKFITPLERQFTIE